MQSMTGDHNGAPLGLLCPLCGCLLLTAVSTSCCGALACETCAAGEMAAFPERLCWILECDGGELGSSSVAVQPNQDIRELARRFEERARKSSIIESSERKAPGQESERDLKDLLLLRCAQDRSDGGGEVNIPLKKEVGQKSPPFEKNETGKTEYRSNSADLSLVKPINPQSICSEVKPLEQEKADTSSSAIVKTQCSPKDYMKATTRKTVEIGPFTDTPTPPCPSKAAEEKATNTTSALPVQDEAGRNNKAAVKGCFLCLNLEHETKNCPTLLSSVCKKCGEKGHLAFRCSKKKKGSVKKSKVSSEEQKKATTPPSIKVANVKDCETTSALDKKESGEAGNSSSNESTPTEESSSAPDKSDRQNEVRTLKRRLEHLQRNLGDLKRERKELKKLTPGDLREVIRKKRKKSVSENSKCRDKTESKFGGRRKATNSQPAKSTEKRSIREDRTSRPQSQRKEKSLSRHSSTHTEEAKAAHVKTHKSPSSQRSSDAKRSSKTQRKSSKDISDPKRSRTKILSDDIAQSKTRNARKAAAVTTATVSTRKPTATFGTAPTSTTTPATASAETAAAATAAAATAAAAAATAAATSTAATAASAALTTVTATTTTAVATGATISAAATTATATATATAALTTVAATTANTTSTATKTSATAAAAKTSATAVFVAEVGADVNAGPTASAAGAKSKILTHGSTQSNPVRELVETTKSSFVSTAQKPSSKALAIVRPFLPGEGENPEKEKSQDCAPESQEVNINSSATNGGEGQGKGEESRTDFDHVFEKMVAVGSSACSCKFVPYPSFCPKCPTFLLRPLKACDVSPTPGETLALKVRATERDSTQSSMAAELFSLAKVMPSRSCRPYLRFTPKVGWQGVEADGTINLTFLWTTEKKPSRICLQPDDVLGDCQFADESAHPFPSPRDARAAPALLGEWAPGLAPGDQREFRVTLGQDGGFPPSRHRFRASDPVWLALDPCCRPLVAKDSCHRLVELRTDKAGCSPLLYATVTLANPGNSGETVNLCPGQIGSFIIVEKCDLAKEEKGAGES